MMRRNVKGLHGDAAEEFQARRYCYIFNKSSSSSTNLTQVDNSNNAASSENAAAITTHGEGNTINILDAGAVEGALNFADSSNARAFNFGRAALDFDAAGRELYTGAVESVATTTLSAATDALGKSAVAQTQGEAQRMLILAAGAAVALITVLYLMRGKSRGS